jgi:hypothetical protein
MSRILRVDVETGTGSVPVVVVKLAHHHHTGRLCGLVRLLESWHMSNRTTRVQPVLLKGFITIKGFLFKEPPDSPCATRLGTPRHPRARKLATQLPEAANDIAATIQSQGRYPAGGPSGPWLDRPGQGPGPQSQWQADHRMLHATSMSLSSYAPGAACPSPSLALPDARCGATSSHASQSRVHVFFGKHICRLRTPLTANDPD